MATWRELLEEAREWIGDGDFIAITPPDLDLDREFDSGWGLAEGKPFTAWTERRVYFPSVYDGAEAVESVPRDPCDEITCHIGGQ